MSIDGVVVHYTSAEHLVDCLGALRRALGPVATIVVVDNDAPDGVPAGVEQQAGVRLIRAGANLGFAAGVNLGARHGDGEYLLIVNPDVRVTAAVVAAMWDLLESDDGLAACAPALRCPDGSLQVGAAGYLPSLAAVMRQALPPLRLLDGGRSLFVPAHETGCGAAPRTVEWLSAACLMIRRAAFERVDGFDERFFLYGEDIDLGRRLGAAGWSLAYVPGLEVEHAHLQVDRGRVHRAADEAWLDGLDLYYRLHSPRTRRLLHAIGSGGFALRALLHALPFGDAAGRAQRDRMVAFMRRSAHHALAS